ncbi:MAG: phosphatidylserine decarboxylase [Lentisphaerae bacterium]|nr:phosphatidylserine decarboxylase [Lentisphaerota bacterium]
MTIPIRPEVLPFLPWAAASGLLLTLLLWVLPRPRTWRARVVPGLLLALVAAAGLLYFFRDPERTPPADPRAVVSGADGVVVRIRDVQEPLLGAVPSVEISVFLGLSDVHVNRAPVSGTVTRLDYMPGAKQPAWRDEASASNERHTFLIEGGPAPCVVRQICGAVARRVVAWVGVGDKVDMGARIGMMKFGSRLEMVLPRASVRVAVKEGQRVTAGETIVARVEPGPAE